MAISGASGPSTAPEAERGEGRDDDAGELDRRNGPGWLESVRGRMTTGSRQVADCESHQQSAQGKQR